VSWATKRGDEDIAQTLFVPNADVREAVEGKVYYNYNDDEDEEFSMRSNWEDRSFLLEFKPSTPSHHNWVSTSFSLHIH
jgi:hypothetical protein